MLFMMPNEFGSQQLVRILRQLSGKKIQGAFYSII